MRALLTACLLSIATTSCLAQVHHAQDASEWASFWVPAAQAERTGPVADHQFQVLKQTGPWHPEPVGTVEASERQLLTLIRQGRAAEALALLKHSNPDPNATDELGATPLSLAAAAGLVELVKELLRRGAQADQRGAGGMAPLGAAAFQGHELVVRELLRQGARTDVASATGQWPLHLACATGQQRVVRQLMAAGADPRAFNREGRHALAEAAYFGQIGVLRQLADAGWPLDMPDQHGRNSLHAAALGQQREAVAWLEQQGVGPTTVLTQVLLDQSDQWGRETVTHP